MNKKAIKRMEIIGYKGTWCREVENMEYALAAVNYALCEHKDLVKPAKKLRKACDALEKYIADDPYMDVDAD